MNVAISHSWPISTPPIAPFVKSAAGAEFISPPRKGWDTVSLAGPESHRDGTMGHTFTTNFVHVVFSTKDRVPLIPADRLENLWAYLIGIAHNHKIETLATGGIRDHVHMLFALPKTMTLADAVGKLKANSSRWLNETGVRFAWQEGYSAFSVSPSQVEIVKAYIANQAEHHKRRDFREEYLVMLRKAGINLDEAHVFD
jgi:putative transposase